ncbi:MAG TPA: DUF5681 domain-containing protein [Novosphingobium sp.]|nr:DUF5681 domain-containing protein [Novosphingobium sp.]
MTGKVGYGSPPEHTRWAKGQSGNPRGRSKGKANFASDLAAELSETIQVSEGGKPKRITKQRALLKSLVTSGIKGDVRAAQLMMNWAAASTEQPEGHGGLPPLGAGDLKLLKNYLDRNPLPTEEKP